MRALLGVLAILAIGTLASAVEVSVSGESDLEVAAKAQASASELADSVRAVDASLSAAVPAATDGAVLSKEAYEARAEAGMKQHLAGLASDLDQISAALSAGSSPESVKSLLDSARKRVAAISRLGVGPSHVAIPPELQAEMLTLWSDVEALSGKRRLASDVAVDSPELDGAP